MTAPTVRQRRAMHWGWRSVHADFTSSRGFRWPFPGQWAEAPGPILTDNRGPCPDAEGDGLCVATTWRGAASGGIPAHMILVVGWLPGDLLGSDDDKVRVRRAFVAEVVDLPKLAREHGLRGADLRGADLRGADLQGARANERTHWPAGFDHAAARVSS